MNIHRVGGRAAAAVAMASVVIAGAASGCGGSDSAATTGTAAVDATTFPQGSESIELDPADFTTEIDNPYLPLTPGSRWVYRETSPGAPAERVVVEVTGKTKTIANGVEAVVVRDAASLNGEPIEVTDDWYAQDTAGNVWYLGEDTAEYENGKVTTRAGSFEAGVDGAQAGIAMPADPRPGTSYRQEYYAGEAEDRGAIVTRGEEQVGVPFGHFARDVVMTRDTVPTEPKVQELKFYAPGVGNTLSIHTDESAGRSELVSYSGG
jgi:hypothetical protein